MFLRSTYNGGVVEVDEEFGTQLIAEGGFEPYKPRKKRAPKTEEAPADEATEEPTTEDTDDEE